MRHSPRSVVALVAAVGVAIVTALIVFGDLSTLHRRANSLGAPRPVVVATSDLPLGATLGPDDVRATSRYASTVPDTALQHLDEAVGRVVAVPVLKDSVVLAGNLTSARRDGLGGLVPSGYRAVRIRTDDGLDPPIGGVVDVLASLDPTVVESTRADVVARSARVIAVDAAENTPSDGVGVTVLVTEDEARGLAFAAANGVLILALAPPEDACCTSHGS
jgi:pilus assembly protein CpaB